MFLCFVVRQDILDLVYPGKIYKENLHIGYFKWFLS